MLIEKFMTNVSLPEWIAFLGCIVLMLSSFCSCCSNSCSGKGGKQNVDYEVKLEFYGEIDPEVCHILVL